MYPIFYHSECSYDFLYHFPQYLTNGDSGMLTLRKKAAFFARKKAAAPFVTARTGELWLSYYRKRNNSATHKVCRTRPIG
jgi:hypothetical protein